MAPINGAGVGWTNYSGTVTTGGSVETPVAANRLRRFLMIANPSLTLGFWFNCDATAASEGAGSVYVGPSGAYIFDVAVPQGAVSIYGATTGQPFTVKEA